MNDGKQRLTTVGRLSRSNRDDVTLVDVVSNDHLVLLELDELPLILLLGVVDPGREMTEVDERDRGKVVEWKGKTKNVRRTDVDLDAPTRSLVKLSNELGLENGGKDGVSFLGGGRVERLRRKERRGSRQSSLDALKGSFTHNPVISQVRESDRADRNERDLSLDGGRDSTVLGRRDEEVGGGVGLKIGSKEKSARTTRGSCKKRERRKVTHDDEESRTRFARTTEGGLEELDPSTEHDRLGGW